MKLLIIIILTLFLTLTKGANLNEISEFEILENHLNANKNRTFNAINMYLINNDNFTCPNQFCTITRVQLKEWARFYLKGLRTEFKPFKDFNEKIGYIDCQTCLLAVPVARLAIATGLTGPLIELAVGICNSMEIIPPEGCDGLIRSFIDPVLQVLRLRPLMQPKDFCGILMGNNCGAGVNPIYTDWDIIIDENKPEPQSPPPLPVDVERAKIIQFTDLHVDLDYKEGSIGNCGSEVGCCRDGEGEGDGRAGKYGHDSCQLPEIGLEEIFTQASEKHSDAKYIFLTGDFIHSVLWLYNKEENTRVHTHVFERINEYFPDIPIYPVVGNHEPDVVNQFAPPELWEDGFDLGWLFTLVDEHFPDAVPDDQKETFLKYGYYHVSPEPGLRLIMINSNLCYTDNFWLAYYTNDSFNELQWLSDTLYDAEAAQDQVLIVGHVSPGSGSCWGKWSSIFDRIIYRYENIIKGQFYGHGHDDEFKIHFSPNTERAISVQYIAPAGNPDRGGYAYKTYFFDGERENATWEMIDHDEWVFDLELSNEAGSPVWNQLYVASEFFEMKSQRPNEVYEFVLRMIQDHELFNNYQWTYSKGGKKHYRECPIEDKNCKIGYLCSTVKADSSDNYNCDIIRNLIGPPLETTTSPTIETTDTDAPVEPTTVTDAPVEPTTVTDAPVEPTTVTDAPVEPTTDTDAPVEPTTDTDAPVEPTTVTDAPVEPTTVTDAPVPVTTTNLPVEPTTINLPITTQSPTTNTREESSTPEATTDSSISISFNFVILFISAIVLFFQDK